MQASCVTRLPDPPNSLYGLHLYWIAVQRRWRRAVRFVCKSAGESVIRNRKIFGEVLKSDRPAAARKEFFERVKKEQVGESAVAVVKEFFFKAAQMPPPAEDKVSMQNELLRLGGLPDEELQYEFSHRLKSVALLKKLANANSLPVSRNAKRAELVERITHYARRAHANIAHRAPSSTSPSRGE